jgi:D-alanyl-D-alanine carboxypeptidase
MWCHHPISMTSSLPGLPGSTRHLLDRLTEGAGWLVAVQREDGTLAVDAAAGLDPHGTFRCASVTKSFTAAAVLRRVEQGTVRLDEPAGVYEQALGRAGYDPDQITVERLLRHVSGLPDHAADPAYLHAVLAEPGRVWSRDEQVAWCLERLRPLGPSGEVYGYSDSGYLLLGALLERRTGEQLPAAVRRLVGSDALGLADTWWELLEPEPPTAPPRVAQYVDDTSLGDVHPSCDLYGGGGLLTTTRDLTTFFRALLDGEVLSPATVELALAVTRVPGSDPRGLGLLQMPFGAGRWWGHTGFTNVCAAAETGSRRALCVLVPVRADHVVAATAVATALVEEGHLG